VLIFPRGGKESEVAALVTRVGGLGTPGSRFSADKLTNPGALNAYGFYDTVELVLEVLPDEFNSAFGDYIDWAVSVGRK
jgi:hypothetical protein